MPAEQFGPVDIDGAGTQNAIGNTVGHDLVLQMTSYVRSRPAMYLGVREIDERVAAYVPARNHDLVVKTLAEDRAVALAGPDGCGREITAIAAIRQLSPAAGRGPPRLAALGRGTPAAGARARR